jgi:hypothetical protein
MKGREGSNQEKFGKPKMRKKNECEKLPIRRKWCSSNNNTPVLVLPWEVASSRSALTTGGEMRASKYTKITTLNWFGWWYPGTINPGSPYMDCAFPGYRWDQMVAKYGNILRTNDASMKFSTNSETSRQARKS